MGVLNLSFMVNMTHTHQSRTNNRQGFAQIALESSVLDGVSHFIVWILFIIVFKNFISKEKWTRGSRKHELLWYESVPSIKMLFFLQ